ncbi:MAG: V-type ATP synthase subunit K, partial [Candidatus Aenigmarchaeota archaeon]|nr:V-type ATP synthase subunit K [Candidatus Aenigmarchaeota archaeon]
GIGQGKAVAAAIGATAENEKLFGKSIAMAVLTETQALYGFAIAIILIAFGFGLITV